jgi:hypothetical protein
LGAAWTDFGGVSLAATALVLLETLTFRRLHIYA